MHHHDIILPMYVRWLGMDWRLMPGWEQTDTTPGYTKVIDSDREFVLYDGKRWDPLRCRWTLRFHFYFLRMGRGLGRGVPGSGSAGLFFFPLGRLADDGKRWDSLSPRWTLRFHFYFLRMGRGLGRGAPPLGSMGPFSQFFSKHAPSMKGPGRH